MDRPLVGDRGRSGDRIPSSGQSNEVRGPFVRMGRVIEPSKEYGRPARPTILSLDSPRDVGTGRRHRGDVWFSGGVGGRLPVNGGPAGDSDEFAVDLHWLDRATAPATVPETSLGSLDRPAAFSASGPGM